MSLDFQNVDVKFTQGLDTKTQAKLVIPGKWNQLKNCALSEDETPTRRDGITSLVAAATGNGLATYNKELLVISGPTVKSISTAGTDFAKTVPGQYGFAGVSKQEIRRSTGLQDSCDVASGNGFTCYVWRELDISATQTSLRMSLLDEATGTQVQADVSLIASASAFCPRVVFAANAFLIFYYESAGTDTIFCRVVQTAAPTVLGAQTAMISAASLAAVNFDACAFDGASAVLAYAWNDGTTSVRTVSVGQLAGVPSLVGGPTNLITAAQLPTADICGLACVAYTTSLFGVFSWGFGATSHAGIAGVTVDNTFTVVTPATQLFVTGPVVNAQCHVTAVRFGANFLIYADNQSSWASTALTPLVVVQTDSTFGSSSGGTFIGSATFTGSGPTVPAGPKGPFIAGKAFSTATNVFLPVCVMENYQAFSAAASNPRTINEQNTLFLLEGSTGVGVVVAKALAGSYGVAAVNANAPRVSTPCGAPSTTSGVFGLACTERTLVSFVGGFNVSPCGVVRIQFTPNTTVPPIRRQLGESGYFAGGSLTSYDGLGVVEHGFPIFPEGVAVEVVVGGGAMTAGVHQVVVIAEWIDNAGQRHQSAPSLAVSVTTALNDRLRIRVPSLLMSQKAGVTLVPFITQAAGSTFNRAVDPTTSSAGTLNDPTAASTTLALLISSDATYAGNELLYTQPNTTGTTLPNIAPGPISAMAVGQNRVFFDKADQPGQFGFSQQYTNNVGLQFNPQLGGTVDVSGGSIVGFETMDEKVIIFCTAAPFVVYGAGPNASGGFSGYGDPQPIPSDVGCVDARSILKMPQGIIFKSAKGWYLLGRDLQVRYIGEGVAEFDGNSVSSAVLLKDRQECRFSSTSGTQLVYSYDANGGEWSTTVYRADSGAGVSDYAVADAVFWSTGGYYASVSTVHGTNRDTPGVFLDEPGGSLSLTIPITYRTSWLRMGIVNGFQRVQRMYLTGTAPERPRSLLNVTVSFDDGYGVVALGSYVFAADYSVIFPTFTVGSTVDINHHMQHQKCKAVAFTFLETPSLLQPAGVAFQAMSMKIGVKRGLRKLPAAQGT